MNVVVVEDDELVKQSFKLLLTSCRTLYFSSADALLAEEDLGFNPDLILLDLCNSADPQGEGSVSLIPEFKRRFKSAELIVQSGIRDIALMRQCIQQGATRFVLKEQISVEVPMLLARQQEILAQRGMIDKLLFGDSYPMRSLKNEILNLRLDSSVDVLFEGETGSGKELCARALHVGGPWVAVNCSAIAPELFEAEFFGAERGAYTGSTQLRVGHFESAANGLLFLDEIQSLPLTQQAKLLRVIESRTFTRVGSSQERPFKARIVSAANRNLKEAVEKGHFREDLYYRIAALSIGVPPLRARKDDIAPLSRLFLESFDSTGTKKFTESALKFMRDDYDWPGNVRELKGMVRAVALKSPIPFFDVPEVKVALGQSEYSDTKTLVRSVSNELRNWDKGFDDQILDFEKLLLQDALSRFDFAEAREKLQISRSRLYEKIKQHGLKL